MPQESTFDEQRVLHELEQLQIAIRATRAQRERVQAEFDAQLRAFDRPSGSRPTQPAQSLPHAAPAIPSAPPLQPAFKPAERVAEHEPEQPSESIAVADQTPGDGLASSSFRVRAIIGAFVVIAALAGFWMFTGPPKPATPIAEPRQAQTTPAQPPLPEVHKSVTTPVDPHVLRIDLKTLRRVWLRVSVDGRIAIEREVAAGEQLPFGADRTIVVRAGDAGAVTVRVGDVDQGPMGKDGVVVSRTFTPPAR